MRRGKNNQCRRCGCGKKERGGGATAAAGEQVSSSLDFLANSPPPSLFLVNSPANGSLELFPLSLLISEGLIYSFAHFPAWEAYDHEPRVLGKVVGIEA